MAAAPHFPPSPGGGIAGVVTDARGRPVRDAAVVIEEGPSHPDIAALTDDSGGYRFDGLAAGTYTILITPPAGNPQRGDAAVEGDRVTRLDFILPDEPPVTPP